MGVPEVREYFKKWNRQDDIMEFEESSATVDLAARTLGVEPGRIAKTLSFRGRERSMLVLTAGDARIDNKKYKAQFGLKASMLSPEEALEQTGHPVGGICPFGLKTKLDVYLDVSLKRFDHVFPACGSGNSAIRCTLPELVEYSGMEKWVDICKD
jgi:prolyl-tRNA editing enzyme YbaK/EbsC (Cys-tRNA(Pro) deacylase)